MPVVEAISDCDVIVVGAGLGGIAALHALRNKGLNTVVVEAGSGPGGTWFWNRYPGARCDIDSIQYSFSFSPEIAQQWTWTEKYSPQPEIQRYIEFVIQQQEMPPHIRYNTQVASAIFDQA